MQLNLTVLLISLGLAVPALAAGCQNTGGVANGECVKYYSGPDCDTPLEEGSYKPTCAGNCFQYSSFDSIYVSGDGTYGTNCYAYSDTNCNNYIGETGNTVVGAGHCADFSGAQSMKCYYRC